MQSKILSKRMLLGIILLGFILFAILLFNFILKNPIQGSSALLIENVATLPNQEYASVGLPVRLKIPAIGVDSAVISVGLTSDGAMDVPKDPTDVAWFNLGPRPGESGSAVINGHYGWKNNIPAVFDNLHKLREGERISVEDEKGVTTTFIVREIRIYDKDDVAFGVFESDDGKAHLNLITCMGDWNQVEKTHSERLVILTDKE